jgi:hypothetical protein
MKNRVFVRPALDQSAEPAPPGQPPARLLVRKPIGGRLAPTGEWQNLDDYWRRRISDGDVEVDDKAVEPTDPAPVAAETAAGFKAVAAETAAGFKAVVKTK